MTHGIEALVGHFAQLLCDALLDHLELVVPLLCVSFETGPLGALPCIPMKLAHTRENNLLRNGRDYTTRLPHFAVAIIGTYRHKKQDMAAVQQGKDLGL